MAQHHAASAHDPVAGPPTAMLNHVGISVPDLDHALRWYQEVLGFRILTPPVEMDATDPQLGPALREMLGPKVKRFRMAHLKGSSGPGLQMFEFLDPAPQAPAEADAYWRTGIFHICVTDPDIDGLAERIARSGGRRSQVWREIPGKPYAAAYCADPFGNVIEINSHGYEETRTFLQET
jgi:catechol 2,3-dioxygenase-like lactoylglutathione lyase family enzyme